MKKQDFVKVVLELAQHRTLPTLRYCIEEADTILAGICGPSLSQEFPAPPIAEIRMEFRRILCEWQQSDRYQS